MRLITTHVLHTGARFGSTLRRSGIYSNSVRTTKRKNVCWKAVNLVLIDSFVKRSHKWQRSLQRVYAAPAVLDLFRVTSVLSIGYVVPMFLCPQALVALPAKSCCLRIAVTYGVWSRQCDRFGTTFPHNLLSGRFVSFAAVFYSCFVRSTFYTRLYT